MAADTPDMTGHVPDKSGFVRSGVAGQNTRTGQGVSPRRGEPLHVRACLAPQTADLFAAAETRSQVRALAELDAWLAATDPQRGTIRPADSGYWPPPVALRDAFPPKPERVNGRAVAPTPFRKYARGPSRRAVAAL